jgi:hypothetical protein
MRKSTHTVIRAALRQMPDGTTIAVISAITGLQRDTVRQALPCMPDVYLDRWELAAKGRLRPSSTSVPQWRAVYIAVPIPPNQPHPTKGDEHVR